MVYGSPEIGGVNWYGLWTLYRMEVWRFLKMPAHTIFAPTATGLLFLAVFSLGIGGVIREMNGVPLVQFIAPGIVVMAIVQSSFENTAATIVSGKLQGTIVDILMPPLSPGEVTLGLVFGGATRGLLTGATLLLLMQPFVSMIPVHPGFVLFHGVGAALLLAMLGLIAGLWAPRWDSLAMVGAFIVLPLAFLSGAFYSIDRLPGVWHTASLFNPFFYMIDGFRYGFTGAADGSLATGVVVVVVLDGMVWLICRRLIDIGYRIKS
jgi:ABC-2 type transport system permease protein